MEVVTARGFSTTSLVPEYAWVTEVSRKVSVVPVSCTVNVVDACAVVVTVNGIKTVFTLDPADASVETVPMLVLDTLVLFAEVLAAAVYADVENDESALIPAIAVLICDVTALVVDKVLIWLTLPKNA